MGDLSDMAHEDPNGDFDINLENLKVDWGNGYPAICAGCGKPIDTETPDEDGEREVPLQLFKGEGKDCQMLQFHWKCGEERIKIKRVESAEQSFSA